MIPTALFESKSRTYVFFGLIVTTCMLVVFSRFVDIKTGISTMASLQASLLAAWHKNQTGSLSVPRVMCMIFTTPGNWAKKGFAVRHTWSRHCHHRRFFYSGSTTDNSAAYKEISQANETLALNVSEGRGHLTAKSLSAFLISYRLFSGDTDWYLKADDDAYFRWQFLVSYLRQFDPDKPAYLGSVLNGAMYRIPKGYNSGGAGYFLSREAARRLVTVGMNKHPDKCGAARGGGLEDVDVGDCLQAIEIYATDTKDAQQRLRFHSQNPMRFLRGALGEHPHELGPYRSFKYNDVTFGDYNDKHKDRILSPEAISFHYVSPAEMFFIDFLDNKPNHARTSSEKKNQRPK